MTRTMAVGTGILSPTVASFHPPVPYLILLVVSTIGFLSSTRLPAPGHHLPQEQNEIEAANVPVTDKSDNVSFLHDFDQAMKVRPTPYSYHPMSHSLTFTEKKLKAHRPSVSTR